MKVGKVQILGIIIMGFILSLMLNMIKIPTEYNDCPINLSNEMKVCTFRSKRWTLNYDLCKRCNETVKSRIKTRFGNLPMYVYDPNYDHLSRSIIGSGRYEEGKMNKIIAMLQRNKTLQFIDIGANIGVISLRVCQIGRRVLAIEALYSNVQRLCCSVMANNFSTKFTIIHNALADRFGSTVNLGVDFKNLGGTFVDLNSEQIRGVKQKYNADLRGTYGNVTTVTLDKLVGLEITNQFKNVIMKMDVEGFEHRVLLGAKHFFDTINIYAVFMEWIFHQQAKSGKIIIDFMAQKGFKAFTENGQILNTLDYSKWPNDILWLPAK